MHSQHLFCVLMGSLKRFRVGKGSHQSDAAAVHTRGIRSRGKNGVVQNDKLPPPSGSRCRTVSF